MKAIRFFLLILLIAWYIACTCWYVCKIQNHSCGPLDRFFPNKQEVAAKPIPKAIPEPKKEMVIPPLVIKNGSTIIADEKGNFLFRKGKAAFVTPSNAKAGIPKLIAYLKSNKNNLLEIQGFYNSAEFNNTTYNNLGIARAEALKAQLVAQGIEVDRLSTKGKLNNRIEFVDDQFAGGLSFLFTENKPAEPAVKVEVKSKPVPVKPLIVKDGKQVILNNKLNFGFDKNKPESELPSALENDLKGLATYLKEHPDRLLEVTGTYTKEEAKPANFENMGFARADWLAEKLASFQAPKDRIKTSSKLDASAAFVEGKLQGGIDMGFSVTEKVKESLVSKSRLLYFASGGSRLIMTDELKKYFLDVKTYLEQNKKAKVILTGYTDSEGSVATNLKLGKKRADAVAAELGIIQIDLNRIETLSKGESNPVGDNMVAKGRQQNRRVEMIIK